MITRQSSLEDAIDIETDLVIVGKTKIVEIYFRNEEEPVIRKFYPKEVN